LSNTTLQGWGRGAWNDGAWNEETPVVIRYDPPSLPEIKATASVNSVVGVPGIFVNVSGVSATTAISQTGASTVTYTVTVVSGNPSNHPYYNQGSTNKYAIGGSTASADVVLTLYEGNTYRFDQSDASNDGHPLRIYTAADKTGGEYTTGVTTNGTAGQAGAYTEITVADGAPTLFYQCSNHALMGATLNTHGIPNVETTTGAPVSANTPVSLAMTSAFNNDDVVVVTTAEVVPSDYNDRLPALQASIKDVVTVPQTVVSLTGVSATGGTGEELVYSLIVPNQTANWREVA
tara:strand:- start:211 stop:1083 length:873 start_codon:yes stop_codon:yes gene_type:complete